VSEDQASDRFNFPGSETQEFDLKHGELKSIKHGALVQFYSSGMKTLFALLLLDTTRGRIPKT
jgi:hypothetical protein